MLELKGIGVNLKCNIEYQLQVQIYLWFKPGLVMNHLLKHLFLVQTFSIYGSLSFNCLNNHYQLASKSFYENYLVSLVFTFVTT